MFQRIVLITNSSGLPISDTLQSVTGLLRARNISIVLDEFCARYLPDSGYPLMRSGELLESCDLAIVIGGDGTMLRALARFLGTDIPVVGVNFGRVGFLSSMARAAAVRASITWGDHSRGRAERANAATQSSMASFKVLCCLQFARTSCA